MSWSSAALSVSGSPARRASTMARSANSAVTGSVSSPLYASAVSNRASAARSPAAERPGFGQQLIRLASAGAGVAMSPAPRLISSAAWARSRPHRPGHPRAWLRRPPPGAAAARRCRSAGTRPRPPRSAARRRRSPVVRRELGRLLVPPLRLAGQAAGEAQLGQPDRQLVRLRRRCWTRPPPSAARRAARRPPDRTPTARRPAVTGRQLEGGRRPGTSSGGGMKPAAASPSAASRPAPYCRTVSSARYRVPDRSAIATSRL